MLGAINRTVRGVDVNEGNLSINVMREVCIDGPVHFLGHEQTLGLMQRDYVYPLVGDRASPKEWNEQGASDVVERAKVRVDDILANHRATPFAPGVDEQIRASFNVLLPED